MIDGTWRMPAIPSTLLRPRAKNRWRNSKRGGWASKLHSGLTPQSHLKLSVCSQALPIPACLWHPRIYEFLLLFLGEWPKFKISGPRR